MTRNGGGKNFGKYHPQFIAAIVNGLPAPSPAVPSAHLRGEAKGRAEPEGGRERLRGEMTGAAGPSRSAARSLNNIPRVPSVAQENGSGRPLPGERTCAMISSSRLRGAFSRQIPRRR